MNKFIIAALLALAATCAYAQPAEVQRAADVMVQIDKTNAEKARAQNEARYAPTVRQEVSTPWEERPWGWILALTAVGAGGLFGYLRAKAKAYAKEL